MRGLQCNLIGWNRNWTTSRFPWLDVIRNAFGESLTGLTVVESKPKPKIWGQQQIHVQWPSREGAEKHVIYTVAFSSHLFMTYFYRSCCGGGGGLGMVPLTFWIRYCTPQFGFLFDSLFSVILSLIFLYLSSRALLSVYLYLCTFLFIFLGFFCLSVCLFLKMKLLEGNVFARVPMWPLPVV